MGGIKLSVLIGQLHAGNQEVILLVAGVGAEDQAVHTVVLALRSEHNYWVNMRCSGNKTELTWSRPGATGQ